jgi:ribonuclease HI
MPRTFTCRDCGASFTVAQAALDKYAGWTPRQCNNCRGTATTTNRKKRDEPGIPPPLPDSMADAYGVEPLVEIGEQATSAKRAQNPRPKPPPLRAGERGPGGEGARRARPQRGPQTGIFTDGFCEPNPGRGGWAAVRVRDGAAVEERSGAEDPTTNNRMELRGLIEAFRMLDADEEAEIYSDSLYSVKTATIWAPGWAAKGWKRKGGEVLNLDLVQELYALAQSHPNASLQWIRGHAGNTWNEHADALARAAADAARR